MVKSYSLQTMLEVRPESCSSAVVRDRQEAFFDVAARTMSFELPKAGEPYDPRLFPPEEWTSALLKAWREGNPSGRDLLHHKIYDDDVHDTVKRHDPAIMRIADAMVDEYLLAYYWEDKVFQGIIEGDSTAYSIANAAENVRAQTSAHYANLLFEQGYNTIEVDKIIRSVNGCFMKFMENQFPLGTGHAQPGISPAREKGAVPENSVRDVRLYAQNRADRYLPAR